MMINRKRMAIACAALMMISLYGCGSSTTQESASAQESTSAVGSTAQSAASAAGEEQETSTVSGGKITAIDGNTVTVALGTMPDMSKMGGGQPSGDNAPQGSDIPEMPSGDNAPQGSDIPEMPSGDNAPQGSDIPEMPSGDDKGQGGDFFTESGETKDIDLTDVTITKGSGDAAETITVSDLAVGDILTWDTDSEDITAVTVMNAGGGQGQPAQGSADSTASSTAESSESSSAEETSN